MRGVGVGVGGGQRSVLLGLLGAVLLLCLLWLRSSGVSSSSGGLSAAHRHVTVVLCCSPAAQALASSLRHTSALLLVAQSCSSALHADARLPDTWRPGSESALAAVWASLPRHSALTLLDCGSSAPLSAFAALAALPPSTPLFVRTVDALRLPSVALDAPRVDALLNTHRRLPALIAALKQRRLLRLQGFGYHPERMEVRWRAMQRSLLLRPPVMPYPPRRLMCVDWGSNAGFFSIQLASFLGPARAHVLGVEGESVDEYRSARKQHIEMARKLGLTNTEVCSTNVEGTEFAEAVQRGFVWDIQFSLSVFHWFTISDHKDFMFKLRSQLMGSRVTFLELPEARVYSGKTGQTRETQLNRWYGGLLDEQEIVERAVPECTVEYLVSLFHDTGTVRTILRVDCPLRETSTVNLNEFKQFLKCRGQSAAAGAEASAEHQS